MPTRTSSDKPSPNSIAIISVGNQAQSWALNLQDSGRMVEVGYRSMNEKVQSFQKLHPHIKTTKISKSWLANQKIICLLIPDDQHEEFLKQYSQEIKPQTLLIYAHGFSEVAYHLSSTYPQFIHALLAPKAIASELRQNYLEKKILAAVYAYTKHPDHPLDIIKELFSIARDLGITWGPFPVTFEQECKADLFSEQTLLCNLLPNILSKGYQTMVDKNIPWQLAFCEIFLELKLIVNALEQVGPAKFFELISPNALMGSEFYRQQWEKDLPFDQLFETCWKNLESGQMIQYLAQTPVKAIRDSVLLAMKDKSLSQAYNQFKMSRG